MPDKHAEKDVGWTPHDTSDVNEETAEFSATVRRTNSDASHFTIPGWVRDQLAITAGDEVVFQITAVEKAAGGKEDGN